MKTYFCDIESPWQKGDIENAIGRLRRTLPRRTNIAELEEQEINQCVALYKHHQENVLVIKLPQKFLNNRCTSNVNSYPSVRWDDNSVNSINF